MINGIIVREKMQSSSLKSAYSSKFNFLTEEQMKSAFILASKKHLFLGFPHSGEKNMLLYGSLTCTMATAQGGTTIAITRRHYFASIKKENMFGKLAQQTLKKFKDTYLTNQVFQRQRNLQVFTMLCRH